MTRCKLTENDRNEAIRKFEQILDQHDLKFISEINVAPVSEIGVPNPITLCRNALKSSAKPIVFLRLVGSILSFVFLIFSFEFNSFVSVSLVTSFLAYLWLDSVLIWFDKEKGKVTINWLMLSIFTSLFIAAGTQILLVPFLSTALLEDPLRFWEILLFGMYLTVTGTFIGAFATYRLYVGIAHFERMLFEDRFVAVRRCLRAKNPQCFFWVPDGPTRAALQSETRFACLKYLLLLALSLTFSYLWPFLYPVPLDIYLVLLCSVSIIGLIVFAFLLVRLVKRMRILARSALTIEIVTIALVSILISFIQPSLLLTSLLYFVGTFLLLAIWKSIKRATEENPQVLGLKYFEYHLASLDREGALHFVNQTLQQLTAYYPHKFIQVE